MVNIKVEVSGTKKGFLWFKKVCFEVTYGSNPRITDYHYSLGDLVSSLIRMGVTKTDIARIVNNLERKFYKIK